MWTDKEYNLQINRWEGRLGNNIQQLCCGIFIAEKTDSCITWPSHNIIPSVTLSFLKENTPATIPIDKIIRKTFFQYSKSCGELLPLYNSVEQRRICETYIRPLFKRILEQHNQLKLTGIDLIIHLRSGDVFNPSTHGLYIQPPFSYYKTIIDEQYEQYEKYNDTRRIIILTEPDKRNPCMNLIQSYIQDTNLKFMMKHIGENIKSPFECIINTDLDTCIHSLLTAENIIIANSSFSQRLVMCNTNIKNIYVTSLTIAEKITDHPRINMFFHEIYNYITHGQWKNSNDQVELMKLHACSDIENKSIELAELPPHFVKTS